MKSRDRRGFALPAAIGGLVIVGVLVTAGFYMARQEVRIGFASEQSALAVNLAQSGANDVMANWAGYRFAAIPVGGDTTLVDTVDSGIWSVRVSNLNSRLFFLSAEGEVTAGGALWSGANRRIGVVARLLTADMDPPAALTTRGTTSIKGGAEVRGEDTDPSGWGGFCPYSSRDKPGVMTNDTSMLSRGGKSAISGNPPWDEDPNIVDSTFTNFGDLNWNQLVEMAKQDGKDVSGLGSNINQTLPDSVGTLCKTGTITNWGDPRDPSSACGAYFPLIFHGGPRLTIQSGGIGQGVLLVDGDLDLRGNFTFNGIIIVQGNFETQGSGNRVLGGVMASNADFDSQSLVGGSVVHNSTCAVQRAILYNQALSRARPLAMRSWIDLSGLINE